MPSMPIDWTSVNWPYVILLALLAFFCAWIGNIAFKRPVLAAVLSTVLFMAGFFLWTYYPHNLPLPTLSPGGQKTVTSPAAPSPAPAAPVRPSNPVKDITPPARSP